MTEQTEQKQEAEIIVIDEARLSFPRIWEAVQRLDPKTGQPAGAKKFSCTLLLDPTNKGHAESIVRVKRAAMAVVTAKWGDKANWPKPDPRTGMGGLILPFGNGNDLKKVYDGYKDMFYVKLADTNRPLIGNRQQQIVTEKDAGAPYGGCYVRARISAWVFFPNAKRPLSGNGVNFNFRSLQFVRDGTAFGSGGSRSADEEFVALGDAPAGAVADDDIPF